MHRLLIKILASAQLLRFAHLLLTGLSRVPLLDNLYHMTNRLAGALDQKMVKVSGTINAIGRLNSHRVYNTNSVGVARSSSDGRSIFGVARSTTNSKDYHSISFIEINGRRFENVDILSMQYWDAIEVGDSVDAVFYIDEADNSGRSELKSSWSSFKQGMLGKAGFTHLIYIKNAYRNVKLEAGEPWFSEHYYAKLGFFAIWLPLFSYCVFWIALLIVGSEFEDGLPEAVAPFFTGFLVFGMKAIFAVICIFSAATLYVGHVRMENALSAYHKGADHGFASGYIDFLDNLSLEAPNVSPIKLSRRAAKFAIPLIAVFVAFYLGKGLLEGFGGGEKSSEMPALRSSESYSGVKGVPNVDARREESETIPASNSPMSEPYAEKVPGSSPKNSNQVTAQAVESTNYKSVPYYERSSVQQPSLNPRTIVEKKYKWYNIYKSMNEESISRYGNFASLNQKLAGCGIQNLQDDYKYNLTKSDALGERRNRVVAYFTGPFSKEEDAAAEFRQSLNCAKIAPVTVKVSGQD